MTRIDFYVLQDVEADARHRFACRLISKAVTAGSSVVLHTPSEADAVRLDSLLWRYPEQRFVPHGLFNTPGAVGAPVVLTWEDPQTYDGVLINLSDEIPAFFGRFDRVAEIVVGSNRDSGRQRYKFYRDRGFPLEHHELDNWETP